MWRLSARVVAAFSLEFVIHLAFFTLLSWLFAGARWMLAYGVFLTAVLLILEWLLGPSTVSSLLEPRWIERGDDPVLWSMVHGEAARAGVKVRRIGIVDSDAPNALVYASLTGRPQLVFTKGLLVAMTYPEVRAVACHLLGRAKSGGLQLMTTLSGLLTVHKGFAGGYIRTRLERGRLGYGSALAAGLGYILHALTYPQVVSVSRVVSLFGDEFSIEQTGDPSRFISALIKASMGCAVRPMDPLRTQCASLKGLMFQDPVLAIRDASAMKEAVGRWGIDLNRLVDLKGVPLPDEDEVAFHAFERFWPQAQPVDRLAHAIRFGKEVRAPIKVGLSWIEE